MEQVSVQLDSCWLSPSYIAGIALLQTVCEFVPCALCELELTWKPPPPGLVLIVSQGAVQTAKGEEQSLVLFAVNLH